MQSQLTLPPCPVSLFFLFSLLFLSFFPAAAPSSLSFSFFLPPASLPALSLVLSRSILKAFRFLGISSSPPLSLQFSYYIIYRVTPVVCMLRMNAISFLVRHLVVAYILLRLGKIIPQCLARYCSQRRYWPAFALIWQRRNYVDLFISKAR